MPALNAALSLYLGMDFCLPICLLFFVVFATIFGPFPYFEKMKGRLYRLHAVYVSVCL
jgi:hypothetical protein